VLQRSGRAQQSGAADERNSQASRRRKTTRGGAVCAHLSVFMLSRSRSPIVHLRAAEKFISWRKKRVHFQGSTLALAGGGEIKGAQLLPPPLQMTWS